MVYYTPEEIDSSFYAFLPSLKPNLAGVILFGVTFVAQIILGVYWRQWWFSITWFCGTALEVLGYAGRVGSYYHLESPEAYKMQLASLIIAPAFHMAGIYYQIAKLITIYGEKYSFLKPMSYSAIFIVADVVSILVQAAGGGIAAAGADSDDQEGKDLVNAGAWIMVGGIAFQVLMMTIFIFLFAWVLYRIYSDDSINYNPQWQFIRDRPLFKYFVPALWIAITFIYARSVYRIAELSEGWRGHLITDEVYFLVLDGLMILLASFTLTVYHPGLALGRGKIPVNGLHYKAKKGARDGSGAEKDAAADTDDEFDDALDYSENPPTF